MRLTVNFFVDTQKIEMQDDFMFVRDTENVYVARFTFSDEWDGFEKVALFKGEDTYRMLLDENNECLIPHEALNTHFLYIGAVGHGDGQIMPTLWTDAVFVEQGATDSNIPEPTPDIYEQLLAELREIKTTIKDSIGQLTELTTANKDTLVDAINDANKSIIGRK